MEYEIRGTRFDVWHTIFGKKGWLKKWPKWIVILAFCRSNNKPQKRTRQASLTWDPEQTASLCLMTQFKKSLRLLIITAVQHWASQQVRPVQPVPEAATSPSQPCEPVLSNPHMIALGNRVVNSYWNPPEEEIFYQRKTAGMKLQNKGSFLTLVGPFLYSILVCFEV